MTAGRGRDVRSGPSSGSAGADEPAMVSVITTAMGGRLGIHLAVGRDDDGERSADASRAQASADAGRVTARIGRWADRLTRHSESSELAELNRDPRAIVPVGPTLGAVLRAAMTMTRETDGLVDVTLLGERLGAEGLDPGAQLSQRGWWLPGCLHRSTLVSRTADVRFDLDGVAKGWIADRALDLLGRWPNAVVDADGDLAIRVSAGRHWEIAVDDPREPGRNLAILRLSTPTASRWGVATSGTSVHRWVVEGQPRHHIIDPRTGRPAVTDVVQATVVAGTALRAEALAKALVVAGSAAGLALLERQRVRGAIVLTEAGETIALPATHELLVA